MTYNASLYLTDSCSQRFQDKHAHGRQNFFTCLTWNEALRSSCCCIHQSLNICTVWLQSQLLSRSVIRYKSGAAPQRCRKIWWRCSRGGVRSSWVQYNLHTSRGQGSAVFGDPKIWWFSLTGDLLMSWMTADWPEATHLASLEIITRWDAHWAAVQKPWSQTSHLWVFYDKKKTCTPISVFFCF